MWTTDDTSVRAALSRMAGYTHDWMRRTQPIRARSSLRSAPATARSTGLTSGPGATSGRGSSRRRHWDKRVSSRVNSSSSEPSRFQLWSASGSSTPYGEYSTPVTSRARSLIAAGGVGAKWSSAALAASTGVRAQGKLRPCSSSRSRASRHAPRTRSPGVGARSRWCRRRRLAARMAAGGPARPASATSPQRLAVRTAPATPDPPPPVAAPAPGDRTGRARLRAQLRDAATRRPRCYYLDSLVSATAVVGRRPGAHGWPGHKPPSRTVTDQPRARRRRRPWSPGTDPVRRPGGGGNPRRYGPGSPHSEPSKRRPRQTGPSRRVFRRQTWLRRRWTHRAERPGRSSRGSGDRPRWPPTGWPEFGPCCAMLLTTATSFCGISRG